MNVLSFVAEIFTLSSSVLQVSSTGVFKLELIQFTNDNGLLIDRTCCNGLLINDSCTQACSTYFRICLKHFQRDITTDQCTYGEFTTDVMGGNSIRFPRASESGTFVNPLEFKIDFAWTVRGSMQKLRTVILWLERVQLQIWVSWIKINRKRQMALDRLRIKV